ncbi:MAG: hypothetical protein VSS75_030480 [Candidatus Parabeggiatoa sp.]|nr:hypothetical protein [Candidatus Parabeggiatoa sp.]
MYKLFITIILAVFLMSGCGGQMSPVISSPEQQRPGLATKWGETRTSRVKNVLFTRANPDMPTATAILYYNDAQGIQAMTGVSPYYYQTRLATRSPVGQADFVSFWIASVEGIPLKEVTVGEQKYVIGQADQRYAIQVHNHTHNSLEAVLSVDGLDVLDGEAASFAKSGYVIAPYSTLQVEGFRQSMDHVAAFRFGSVAQSYANRKQGDTSNVGVIGLAIFHEQGTYPFSKWRSDDIQQRKAADPFPGRFATPPD